MQIISGIYRSRKLLAPKGQETRPTSSRLREALFNICRGTVEGADFLDLFAGSGAMGFEALSRGARSAVFVDSSRESIRCIRSNAVMLDVESQIRALYSDVFDSLKKLSKEGVSYDIIYADPPYSTYGKGQGTEVAYSTKVLLVIDDLIEAGVSVLKPGGSVFIEEAVEAAAEQKREYRHLKLQSARTMGRSTLYHWVEASAPLEQPGGEE
jgi:16S rRNA (guanine966-N2)-methyltransferase